MEENKSGVIANLEQDNPAIENKIDAVGLKVDEVATKVSAVDANVTESKNTILTRLDSINSDIDKPLNELIDNKQIYFSSGNSKNYFTVEVPFMLDGRSFAKVGNLLYFFGVDSSNKAVYSYDVLTREVVKRADMPYENSSQPSNKAVYFGDGPDNPYPAKIFIHLSSDNRIYSYDVFTDKYTIVTSNAPNIIGLKWMIPDIKRKALLCVSNSAFTGSAFYRYKIADGTWETITTGYGDILVKLQPFAVDKLCVLTRPSTTSSDISFWVYDVALDKSKLMHTRTGDTHWNQESSIESYAMNNECILKVVEEVKLITSDTFETRGSPYRAIKPYLSYQSQYSNMLLVFGADYQSYIRYYQNGYFMDLHTGARTYFRNDCKVFTELNTVNKIPKVGPVEVIDIGFSGGEFIAEGGNYYQLGGVYTI